MNIDVSNLYTIDLICHGPTLDEVAEQFIDKLEKKYKSSVREFSVRYKKAKWTPPYLYVKFDNGKEYLEEFYRTDYGIAFSKMSLKSCYNCKVKGENRSSDITIGDYWGIDKETIGFNEKGVSVAICHTNKGEYLLQNITEFDVYETSLDRVIDGNPRYISSVVKSEDNEKFEKDFKKYGLSKACWRSMSIKGKIYRIIKYFFEL